MRLLPRLGLLFAPTAVVLVALAGPAAAHTGFESSDPADGATIDLPLDEITLVFSGEAEPTGDGFQILDPSGELRIPTASSSDDGLRWVLRFDPPLGGGVVGVRWMVKAPDAHPIDGSFSFTASATTSPVTIPEAQPASIAVAPLGESVASPKLDLSTFLEGDGNDTEAALRVGSVGRIFSLAGALVAIGGLVFAAVVLRGDPRDIRLVLFWVRRAGLIVVIGALIELAAQLAIDGGGEWSAVASPASIGAVLFSPFGIAVALRIGGGMAVTSGARMDVVPASTAPDPVAAIRELVSAGAGVAADHRPTELTVEPSRPDGGVLSHDNDHAWLPGTNSAGALLGALALLAAHLFDGHTVTKGDRLLTGIVDLVHVAGGAVWVGGVLMLVAVIWARHNQGRDVRALQLAIRFSPVATVALVAVGVAGLVLAIIILDSPAELWTTAWGRLLVAKTVFVAAAAGVGGYNHTVLIPEMYASPHNPKFPADFRAVVTAEAVLLFGVLVVTAFLLGAAS